MLEVADNALDRVFHAEEPVKRAIHLDRSVEEHARQPRIAGRVNELRFADGRDHPLCGRRIHHGIVAGRQQIVPQGHALELLTRIGPRERIKDIQ